MQVLSGRRHVVQGLAFSRCGRWLAAGGSCGVHVWDTANPTARPLCPVRVGRATGLAFRTDDRLFFHIRYGHRHLFDPAAEELKTLGSTRAGYLVPSPDGQRFVPIYVASPVCVWEVSSEGNVVKRLSIKCPRARIIGAAFAPDGGAFATVEAYTDAQWRTSLVLAVRDTSCGKAIATINSAAPSTSQVRFSASGEYLLANWGASLACWNLAEPGKPPRKAVNPGRKHFLAMAIHPEGPLLTVANDRLVRVWDVPSLAVSRTIEWNIGKLHAVAVSPDGTRAAVGSHTGKVLVWDWD